MMYVLWLLLQMSFVFADADDMQYEQALHDDRDTVISVDVEIEPNDVVAKDVIEQKDVAEEQSADEKKESIINTLATKEETEVEKDENQTSIDAANTKAAVVDDKTDDEEIEDEPSEAQELQDEENIMQDQSVEELSYAPSVPKADVKTVQNNGLQIQTISSKVTTETINPKKIIVINNITPAKTAYKHWTGTYEPVFTTTVAGQAVGMASQETVEIVTDSFSIAYYADFPAQRSSEDSMTVHLEKDTKTISVDFDWDGSPRLRVTQSS